MDTVFFAYEVPWYAQYEENLYDNKINNLLSIGIWKTMEGAQTGIERRLKEKNQEFTKTYIRDPIAEGYVERVEYALTQENTEAYRKVIIQEITLLID